MGYTMLWVLVMVGLCYVVSEAYTLAEEWDHEKQAVMDADQYLSAMLDESVEAWKVYAGPIHEARNVLYEFDRREAMVKRPDQSWALIPYAQKLVEYLGGENVSYVS